jgi:16S rRNA (uracil1498-N3)-methyltransferase
VFHFVPGDKVILFDNSGYQYLAEILSFDKDGVSFTLLEKQINNVRPERETWLYASIIKKDNFEWIVEKATELGVAHIVPVISDRTEKKNLNLERLSKVSIEAAEQSGRATLPEIHEICSLAECLEAYKDISSLVWEPTVEKFDREELKEIRGIYIGPEGGWTEKELQMFKEKGITVRSLGPQILRAETAVVAALAQIVF